MLAVLPIMAGCWCYRERIPLRFVMRPYPPRGLRLMADGMGRSVSVGLRARAAVMRGRGDAAKKTGMGWAVNIHELFAGGWEYG